MDRLEDFIRKNREGLDKYSPSSGVWRHIRKGINGTSRRRWLSIAAMLVAILGTAAIFVAIAYLRPGARMAGNHDPAELKKNSQLHETEIYYNNLVNSLYSKATPLLTANPEIRKELSTDFSHLDSIYTEIRKDLKDNIANQEVVEALIQNYRIKIQLLEDMLVILKENENNPEKKKNYEL